MEWRNTPNKRGSFAPFFSCLIFLSFRFIFQKVYCDLKVHTWYQIELLSFRNVLQCNKKPSKRRICYLQEFWFHSLICDYAARFQSEPIMLAEDSWFFHVSCKKTCYASCVLAASTKKGYCIKLFVHQGCSKFK